MKIVLTDCKTVTNGDVDLKVLEKYGEVVYYELTSSDELVERIKDADAVICNKTVIDESVMEKCENLKYIGLFATGYNNIDVDYAGKHGITVCNAGSYSTEAVAQHTFAFILNHYNKTAKYNEFVQEGNWKKSKTFSPFVFPINELAGKTIGIVGYGSIGREVAKIAKAFSMKVLVYTRTKRQDDSIEFVSFDELLERSDIVSVHCPLNESSKKMFCEEAFSKFRDGAYFINTARGGVIDEVALVNAVKRGKISGAAIDVLEYEPMREDCILFGVDNITITPHIAWAPYETRVRLLDIVSKNLEQFIAGNPQNVVS